MLGSAVPSVSMKHYITCVLMFTSLNLVGAAQLQWEVINDVAQPNDLEKATEQEILIREGLLPYVRPKPKSRKQIVKEKVDRDKTIDKKDAHDATGAKKTVKVPVSRNNQKPEKKGSFGDEELLPLGVPHFQQRKLLQIYAGSGPRLPPAMEIRRLQEKVLKDNLSFPCKDEIDEDCLFDIDNLMSKKPVKVLLDGTTDDNEEEAFPLSRHKRQSNNNNNNGNNNSDNDDDTSDSEVEGSGLSSSEELYKPEEVIRNEGTYKPGGQLIFNITDTEPTDEQKVEYQKDIEDQLQAIFNDFPGFGGVTVEPVQLINGLVAFDFILTIDGNGIAAAASAADQDVEDYLKSKLEAVDSLVKQIKLNGTTVNSIDVESLLVAVLSDYCASEDPCPNAAPEFNRSACVNIGFMAGYCPHKCSGYPCQNGAACELDSSYSPVCNCGKRFEGQYCQTRKQKKKKLNKPEKVGIAVAGSFAACAAFGCCLMIKGFRNKSQNPDYSVYEDEGSEEAVRDPTMLSNFYIDRPRIARTPIPVFNPAEGSPMITPAPTPAFKQREGSLV